MLNLKLNMTIKMDILDAYMKYCVPEDRPDMCQKYK